MVEHWALESHFENMPMEYTEIFSAVKIEKFNWKKLDIPNMFGQNIDCVYHIDCFSVKNKKNAYPCKPQLYYTCNWGSRGYTFHGHVFLMERLEIQTGLARLIGSLTKL